MRQNNYGGQTARKWIFVLCGFWLASCQEASPPPVVEPAPGEIRDPFIAEFLEPHIAAAKQNPADAEMRGTLGLVYSANKMWEPARQAFLNAALLDPKAPEWSFHAALMAFSQGNSAEAERRVLELCEGFPDYAPARARYGMMLSDRGEFEAALAEFKTCVRLDPTWVEGSVSVAETLVQLGRAAEALPILESAERQAPDYLRIRYVRGQAFMELGRKEEAELELIAGLGGRRLNLSDHTAKRLEGYLAGYEAQNGKAVDLIRKQRYSEAIPILERVLLQQPGDASISNNLSVAYRSTGKLARATELLLESADKNPTHLPTMINLSGCYWESDDFDEALNFADRAIELVPTNGRARYTRARALVSLNRHEEARLEYLESVRLDSSQTPVFALLAETEMRLSRYGDAAEHWKTVLQKAPGNFVAEFNLIKCLARLGRGQEAELLFRKLEASAPDRPEVKALGKELGR